MKNKPSISIIIPTLNAGTVLDKCLASIRKQDYPAKKIELIIADAGSNDDTLKIAERHGIDKILDNPLKTGEAGKAVGVSTASNEIIALIDSDNILDGPDWLARMTAPFLDPELIASEPL